MIVIYVIAYFICIVLISLDKELNPLREKYGEHWVMIAAAIISTTLIPIGVYLFYFLRGKFAELTFHFTLWRIKRKVNAIAKKHGIKDRV